LEEKGDGTDAAEDTSKRIVEVEIGNRSKLGIEDATGVAADGDLIKASVGGRL